MCESHQGCGRGCTCPPASRIHACKLFPVTKRKLAKGVGSIHARKGRSPRDPQGPHRGDLRHYGVDHLGRGDGPPRQPGRPLDLARLQAARWRAGGPEGRPIFTQSKRAFLSPDELTRAVRAGLSNDLANTRSTVNQRVKAGGGAELCESIFEWFPRDLAMS